MVDQIQQFEYQYLIAGTASPAGIVKALTASGVDLQGFSVFPHGLGESQVDLITDDAKVLEETAANLGWRLSEKESMFLIQGDGPPNAISGVLGRLAETNITVTAVQAVSAGGGRFGALLWVKTWKEDEAAALLRSSAFDLVWSFALFGAVALKEDSVGRGSQRIRGLWELPDPFRGASIPQPQSDRSPHRGPCPDLPTEAFVPGRRARSTGGRSPTFA